jgi:SRSO17 transposase
MGYVSRHDHAWLDFRLSLPQDWVRDAPRRQACHVPEDVRYQTRHEQCLEMLAAWGHQVPHGWVTGDDELGRQTQLRHALRERGERYLLGVPCTTTIRDLEAPGPVYQERGRPPKPPWQSVTVWRRALVPEAWTHVTVRDGEKGPVGVELVTRRVQTRLERKRTGPEEWLVVTRSPLADGGTVEEHTSLDACDQDAHYGYRYYLTPTCVAHEALQEPPLGELARVITAGLCIEASFKRGKGEAGMDEYQVRTWEGWHHHLALTLIAVWFLIITTGEKVGQNHRFKNEPRRQVGALVPCCRWKNDKKWRLGAMLGMDCPPSLQLYAVAGVRLTFCDSCSLPGSRPPSCARAGRRSP